MVAIFLERPERAFSKEAGEGSLLCSARAGVARLARCSKPGREDANVTFHGHSQPMIGILFDVKESKHKKNEQKKKVTRVLWITSYEIMRSCQLWVKERNAGGRKKEGHEIKGAKQKACG